MELETVKREWTEHVLNLAADRFERRLAEELSGLRVEIATGLADVRQELHRGLSDGRKELNEGLSSVRVEMANMRVEWLRWTFLFWLGQIAVVAGMLGYLLRVLGR